MSGLFITFEGVEGAGKSTVLSYIYETLIKDGYEVIQTREPGGIEIAEKIRDIILNVNHTHMDKKTEALLYAAARRQHLAERVIPALNEGKIVLCDRFIDSSLAYQGYARGLGIDEVFEINAFAIDHQLPDLTIFFQIDPEKGLMRIKENEGRELNRLDLESLNFHQKVAEGYDLLLERFQDRIRAINADQSIEQVKQDCLSVVKAYIADNMSSN